MSEEDEDLRARELQAQRNVAVARQLTSMLKLVRLHANLDNVVFDEQIPALEAALGEAFEEERSLLLEAKPPLVTVNRRIVREVGETQALECHAALRGLGLGGIWLERTILEDLRPCLEVLAAHGREGAQALNEALDRRGILSWVRVIGVEEAVDVNERQVQVGDPEYFPLAFSRLLILLREHDRYADHPDLGGYFTQKLYRVASEIARVAPQHARRLLALTKLRDPGRGSRYHHSANVGLTSMLLGLELGLPRRHLADLALAGFLSQRSTEAGAASREAGQRATILASFLSRRDISQRSLNAVVCLARATASEQGTPHPFSRIVELCRDYDGLIGGGRGALAIRPDEAIHYLLSMGQHPAALVQALANLLGVFPTGAVARLSTGEVAVVIYPNPGVPGRPLVSIAKAADGSEGGGRLLDLAERDVRGRFRAWIVELLDPAEQGVDVDEHVIA